jgi:N-acyl-D-amino-acid deacylase
VINDISPDLLPRITLAHVPAPELAWTEGLALTEVAARLDRDPATTLLDVLVETRLAASAVIAQPPTTDDDALRVLLRHPCHMGGSDGIYIGGHPHPRGWEAAVHLAAHPARRFGLTDRGILRPGLAADIAVIDPVRVGDRATYAQPRLLAEGVDDVVVNGEVALRNGQPTGALAGAALSPVTA